MEAQPPKPRVGLLALTLELYETLAPQLRTGREKWLRDALLPALEPIADVRFQQAVYRREEIDAAVAELERDGAHALLVVCLTYSPSQLALPALSRTRLPIVVWNTQELYAVDETFDGSKMTANHGVHGTQDLCNVLLRSGVRFEYVTSHLDDADALAGLEDVLVAAAAAGRLRHARLGLLGYPFPGMGDLGLDTTHLAATLGCHWRMLAVEDFNQRAASAGGEEVAHLVAEYRQTYDLAGDLAQEDLEQTARAELALRRMVADHKLDALSYQFLALGEDERTVTIPFVGISRLMAEGIGFGGEGDLIGAAGTWPRPGAGPGDIQRDIHDRLRGQSLLIATWANATRPWPHGPESPPRRPPHSNRSHPRPAIGIGRQPASGAGDPVRPDPRSGWTMAVGGQPRGGRRLRPAPVDGRPAQQSEHFQRRRAGVAHGVREGRRATS